MPAKKAPAPARKRLRLVKAVVQPFVVVDDGDTITELAIDPVAVSAAEWPSYATGTFAEQLAALEDQING